MGKLGKHDHKLTNLLKACIFSLVMLAPLIAIGVRCLYVINNKNAYESYSDTYVYKNTSISNNADVTEGTKYTLTSKGPITANQFNCQINYISLTKEQLNITQSQYENINFIIVNTQGYIRLSNSSAPTSWIASITNEEGLSFDIIFNTSNNNYDNLTSWFFVNQIVLETNKLDNVFYYSIKDLEQQSTFNWVQNTAIYVPLNAMCSGLGITESAIPILLTYWALMTLIYIVFDIIIYLFTKMTHFLGTN